MTVYLTAVQRKRFFGRVIINMSKKRLKHRGIKGNALLAFISVLLGLGVVISAALFYMKMPSALTAGTKSGSSSVSSSSAISVSSSADGVSSGTEPNKGTSGQSDASSSSAPVTSDINNSLFIGDSLTSGLSIYSGMAGKNIIYSSGLSASNASARSIKSDGKSQTVIETAAQKNLSAIYVMLGANDIAAGYSSGKFSSNYGQFIDKLKSSCKSSTIYVESVLPVTAKYNARGTSITNKKIDDYNTALKAMCTEKSVAYCDVASALKDSDGCLDTNLSSDGFHLNKSGYEKWISYLKSH